MPPDLEEFHCELCDCTFEVRSDETEYQLSVNHCPYCGEPLNIEEL